MTDKEQIIINGVDVSGCCYFDYENEGTTECDAYGTECCAQNCYYKQFQRKTQECVKLNNKIIDMNSIIEDAAINLGNKDFTLYDLPFEIKKLSQECDTLKSQLDFEVQQKECIEQECEELKEELKREIKNTVDMERLAKSYGQDMLTYRQEKQIEIEELQTNIDRHRKALDEIEEIVKRRNYLDYSELLDDILNIINKAKGEE